VQRIQSLREFADAVINRLIFQPYCLIGNHVLPDGELLVCNDCLGNLPVNPLPHRPHGWLPQPQGSIEEIMSYWEFSEGLQDVIHELKYQRKPSLGYKLGTYLSAAIPSYILPSLDIIIPIPLHKTKLRERGYNQAEYIANGISDQWNIPSNSHILFRQKFTRTQTRLNKEQRAENLKEAFVVDQSHANVIAAGNILLVDDVFTTGATMENAAKILWESGAGKIYGLTLATAPLKQLQSNSQ
jgi:ComF family protein